MPRLEYVPISCADDIKILYRGIVEKAAQILGMRNNLPKDDITVHQDAIAFETSGEKNVETNFSPLKISSKVEKAAGRPVSACNSDVSWALAKLIISYVEDHFITNSMAFTNKPRVDKNGKIYGSAPFKPVLIVTLPDEKETVGRLKKINELITRELLGYEFSKVFDALVQELSGTCEPRDVPAHLAAVVNGMAKRSKYLNGRIFLTVQPAPPG